MKNEKKRPVTLDAIENEEGVYTVPPLGLLAGEDTPEEDLWAQLQWKYIPGAWGYWLLYRDNIIFHATGTQ